MICASCLALHLPIRPLSPLWLFPAGPPILKHAFTVQVGYFVNDMILILLDSEVGGVDMLAHHVLCIGFWGGGCVFASERACVRACARACVGTSCLNPKP